MSARTIDIKELFKISIKSRHDDVADQYSRIFMMKLFSICSIVTGLSWYTDSLHCVIPGFDPDNEVWEAFSDFVVSTCWIQGVYIYRELYGRNDQLAYFGVTRDIDLDGILPDDKSLCSTYNKLTYSINKQCSPMTKVFYRQYQYTPFLLAALAIMYYVPYIIHLIASNDIINLQKEIKKDTPSAKHIHQIFFNGKFVGSFNNRGISVHRNVWHYLGIMIVKVLYVCVNLFVFYALAFVYGQNFYDYGTNWWKWNQFNNTQQYDYLGSTNFPKPGNEVLPPFGYCELHTSSKDIKHTEHNKMKVVCEISQHVLYQYALVLLWFCVIVGVVVSFLGCFYKILKFVEKMIGFRKLGEEPCNKVVIENLNYRQIEYLDFMHKHNISLYGEVMELLRGEQSNEELPVPKDDVES